MLRVIGKNEQETGQVEVDYYIPLKFTSRPLERWSPIIFHTGDHKHQLLEIEIERRTGELFDATLVSAGDNLPYENDRCLCHGIPQETGLPIIDTLDMEEDVIKNPSRFQLVRSGNIMGVLLDDSRKPTRCLTVDRAIFILSDDLLVGICYGPLSEDEMDLIDESLRNNVGHRNG